jgi:hypothetical protein
MNSGGIAGPPFRKRWLSLWLSKAQPELPLASDLANQPLRASAFCVDFTHRDAKLTQYCAYDAQMLSRRITFADLAAVGRVDRHRLRNLLKDLPEFAARPANERVATEYTRHDLAVVAVLCELERMGLRKDAIARWVSPIQQALSGPRPVNAPQLLLTCDPTQATLGDGHSLLSAGLVVDLYKILCLVDDHCAGVDVGRETQRDLEFGPVSVGRSKSLTPQSKAHRHG